MNRFVVIYAAGTSLTPSLDEETDVKPLLLLLFIYINIIVTFINQSVRILNPATHPMAKSEALLAK